MTNDPRGFPMQSYDIFVSGRIKFNSVMTVRAHSYEEALDMVDEETLLDYHGDSLDDLVVNYGIDIDEVN